MFKKIVTLFFVIVMVTTSVVHGADTYGGYSIPVDIDVNGSFIKCLQKPLVIEGVTYIPLRAFADAVGAVTTWDAEDESVVMTKSGHTFVFDIQHKICTVDGAVKDYDAFVHNELTFIPVRAVSEMLGYDVQWDDFYLAVKITAPDVVVADGYKDISYTYEDVLYLGKITHIESGYEPFNVKLGIAGTIVNRVKSTMFPNSIKGVIFDTKYGVQFPPAHTDKINRTPSKESIIAAKCVLNGVNVVADSLYFAGVSYAAGSWVHNNRPYYTTIGRVSFYR